MIDERTRAALARLTENERICLARRLRHQTAKEMAIDLGISPHAVEKRLKMARTKLGVSSSLEAARLLEASEGGGHAVPEPSDLGPDEAARQAGGDPAIAAPAWQPIAPYLLTGAIAMSLAVLAVLAVAPLPSPVTTPQAPSGYLVQLLLKQGGRPLGSPSLVVAPGQFARATATGPDGARYDITVSVVETESATYLVKMDLHGSSGNGRAFHATPSALVKAGAPTALTIGPADAPLDLTVVVTPAGDATSAAKQQQAAEPGTTSIVKTIGEWEAENNITRTELAKASPETVRAYVNWSFDALDKDRSGFVERREVLSGGVAFETVVHKGPGHKPSERPLYPDKNLSVAVIGGEAGKAAWVAVYDKDENGKVSRDEYMAENYRIHLARGLPVGWRLPGPPPEMVKAPAETVRLFLNESFAAIDQDHSGAIERAEVPASIGATPAQVEAKSGSGGKGPARFVPNPEARTAWLTRFDTNADGVVDREEYLRETFATFENWGVPASWHGAPKVTQTGKD
jgi:DNA-binding CsgD family transcriptional regulator/Ca2+-binding EF-hand superfamily protein